MIEWADIRGFVSRSSLRLPAFAVKPKILYFYLSSQVLNKISSCPKMRGRGIDFDGDELNKFKKMKKNRISHFLPFFILSFMLFGL